MFIPKEHEARAVTMFRDVAADPTDEAMRRIHAAIWPNGNASVSTSTLRTLLRTISAAQDVAEPSDELPDDVDQALKDLTEARNVVMEEIRVAKGSGGAADGEEAGSSPIGWHRILVANVQAHVAVSTHRIALQKHRAEMDELRDRRNPSNRDRS